MQVVLALRSARPHENIQTVEELVCSQEGQPGTSKSPREIARETGMSHSSVRRIVKKDLNLKTFRRRDSWSPAVIRRRQEDTTESLPTTEGAYDHRQNGSDLVVRWETVHGSNANKYPKWSHLRGRFQQAWCSPRATAQGQKTLLSECRGVGGVIETWRDITGVCWTRC